MNEEGELNEVEILIVEDNPHDLELTLRALKAHHVSNRILALRDGAEAIDYLFSKGEHSGSKANRKPRVIFLDLKLPKVDGLEVLRRVKSDPVLKTIPVVMLTSSTEEKDRLQSYEHGVNSFIVKPVEFEHFAEAMARAGFYWVALNRPPEDDLPAGRRGTR